jgi:hypothetical protein
MNLPQFTAENSLFKSKNNYANLLFKSNLTRIPTIERSQQQQLMYPVGAGVEIGTHPLNVSTGLYPGVGLGLSDCANGSFYFKDNYYNRYQLADHSKD